MNPFKHKQLDEFTITDCEQYIAHYPYGERIVDVKRKLKQLKERGKKKRVVETKGFMGDTPPKRYEHQARKKKPAGPRINETQRVPINSYTVTPFRSNDSGKVINMGDTPPKRYEHQARKKKPAQPRINETQRVPTNSYTVTSSRSNDSEKVAKNILMWVLIIVGVIIAGTILLIIIEAMFPGMKLNSGILKYAIYPVLLGVGKWIKDQFD